MQSEQEQRAGLNHILEIWQRLMGVRGRLEYYQTHPEARDAIARSLYRPERASISIGSRWHPESTLIIAPDETGVRFKADMGEPSLPEPGKGDPPALTKQIKAAPTQLARTFEDIAATSYHHMYKEGLPVRRLYAHYQELESLAEPAFEAIMENHQKEARRRYAQMGHAIENMVGLPVPLKQADRMCYPFTLYDRYGLEVMVGQLVANSSAKLDREKVESRNPLSVVHQRYQEVFHQLTHKPEYGTIGYISLSSGRHIIPTNFRRLVEARHLLGLREQNREFLETYSYHLE